jgi:cytochrome oxidase Cu insertion factor (SCO1/SenC/PrrC family)
VTTLPPNAQRPRLIPQFLIGGAVIIFCLMVYKLGSPPSVPPEAESHQYFVPSFALTERSGRTITNDDLYGHIWVADFIYTTCPGPCPLVSASMAKLQAAVAGDPMVQLVTFTVDPETDTPAALRAYADKLGASPDRWWFLTGTKQQMYSVITNGFMLPVVDNSGAPPQPGQYKVTHSTQVALVDKTGVIRGYFDGLSADGRSNVLTAITKLEKQSTP